MVGDGNPVVLTAGVAVFPTLTPSTTAEMEVGETITNVKLEIFAASFSN